MAISNAKKVLIGAIFAVFAIAIYLTFAGANPVTQTSQQNTNSPYANNYQNNNYADNYPMHYGNYYYPQNYVRYNPVVFQYPDKTVYFSNNYFQNNYMNNHNYGMMNYGGIYNSNQYAIPHS